MRKKKKDYLKYWRIIRYWAKRKWNLSTADLEYILFLYTEEYFDRKKLKEFNGVVSWDRHRLKRMIDNGWIVLFRQHMKKTKAVYCLSLKATRMCDMIYRVIDGEDDIPVDADRNPLFRRDVGYADKVYRHMIKSMNEHRRLAKIPKPRKPITDYSD